MSRASIVPEPAQDLAASISSTFGMPSRPGRIVVAVGLGLLVFGLILIPIPAALTLAALGLGLPLFLLVWYRPELGLLAIIFLTSSFIPPDMVDVRLPIGGGLDLRDLALMGMLLVLVFRGLVRKNLTIPWWPVSLPLLVFLGMTVFSGFYALFLNDLEPNWTLGDLRILSYYAVFFVAVWSIASRRQLMVVLGGLFLIADLTAGIILLQQFFGVDNPLLAAMYGTQWHLWQQAAGADQIGAFRIIPPGQVLLYFMMGVALCLLLLAGKTWLRRVVFTFQFVFLNIGLLFTYTRSAWIAAAITILLITVVLFPVYRSRLASWVVIGIPILLILVPLLLYAGLQSNVEDAPLVDVLTDRVRSNTLDWRLLETEESLRSISVQPVLGVGLGIPYRDLTLLGGEVRGWWSGSLASGDVSRFTRYVHNSYLAIAVKMGLSALMCFLWFCAAFLVGSWRLHVRLADKGLKAIVLGVAAGFVGLMAWSILHSHFIEVESTSTVGLMVGLVASIHTIHSRRSVPILERTPPPLPATKGA